MIKITVFAAPKALKSKHAISPNDAIDYMGAAMRWIMRNLPTGTEFQIGKAYQCIRNFHAVKIGGIEVEGDMTIDVRKVIEDADKAGRKAAGLEE